MSSKSLFFISTCLSLSIFTLESATADQVQNSPPPKTPDYFNFKSDGFEINVGGAIKLDGMYDVNAQGSDYGLNPAQIPLNGVRVAQGNSNIGIKASRLHVGAAKSFGDVKTRAFVEIDFAHDGNATTVTPSPRLRQAYVAFNEEENNSFLVGQTWMNFADLKAFARTLDNYYGAFWNPQVQYKRKFGNFSLAVSLEKPDTSYIDSNNNLNDNNGLGVSKAPDLAAQFVWTHGRGHLALRGIARSLQAFVTPSNTTSLPSGGASTVNLSKRVFGWGLGFSGRFNVYEKNSIYWQVNGGQGVNYYIDDSSSQDIYVQYPTAANPRLAPRVKTILTMNYILGVEVWYTDRLSSNFSGSLTKMSKINGISVSLNNYNRLQQRFFANLIYKILPSTDIGLEAMHFKRTSGTTQKFKGKDTRFLISLIYKFGA
jgi:hypothetical protein